MGLKLVHGGSEIKERKAFVKGLFSFFSPFGLYFQISNGIKGPILYPFSDLYLSS